jgi:hypothetical protein
VVDVWCPIIPDTPSQRVVRIAVQAPDPWTIGHDTPHGNRMLHARSAAPYVEVDGQPSGTVPRRIAVVETDGSRGLGTQPWSES